MAYKKEYEAYFADTFDRDSTLCSYTSGENSCAKGVATSATGMLNYSVSMDAFNFRDRLEKLQAKIDKLTQDKEAELSITKLRSTLATLKYKREVE